jgi:hypothetical protein
MSAQRSAVWNNTCSKRPGNERATGAPPVSFINWNIVSSNRRRTAGPSGQPAASFVVWNTLHSKAAKTLELEVAPDER